MTQANRSPGFAGRLRYAIAHSRLFSRFDIRRRLILSFACVIGIMLFGNGVLLWQLRLIRIQVDRSNGVNEELIEVLRVHTGLLSAYERLEALARSEDSARLLKESSDLRASLLMDAQRTEAAFDHLPPEAKADRTVLTTLESIERTLPSHLDAIISSAKAAEWAAVRYRIERQVQPLESLSSGLVNDVANEVEVQRHHAALNIDRAEHRMFLAAAITGILTLLIAAGLGVGVTNSITEPLGRLVEGAKSLASGEFRHVVQVGGEDELAQLSKVFNETTDKLAQAFDEIKVLRDQVVKENIALREEVDKTSMFEEIVGKSDPLRSVLMRVSKVAPTESTILVTGETGTGKELIARAIHKRSRRSYRAFVNVNCAAIPTSLIASELFGHEKGAFTGALQRRLGRFELADGGTIFLDEIGELPMDSQTALLRVLQEREFERVGGSRSIPVDVRVIAATNRNLQAAISSGTFRSDLFYRLNVVPMEVPPLRSRRGDIPMLIAYFVDRYARKLGKRIRTVEKRTMELLESYSWPGNIRELQNVIERSVVVCDGEVLSVEEAWLSVALPFGSPEVAERQSSRRSPEQERVAIEEVLVATQGRVSGPFGAAARLGIPASTLESKIRTLNIDKYRFKRPNSIG